jgi:hypothetical protein
VAAVLLNLYFNGTKSEAIADDELKEAATVSGSH